MSGTLPQPAQSELRARGRVWPAALAAALAVQAALVLVMVVVSSRDPSFALEPDYYSEAVRWDEHAAERDASKALGWTGRLTLGPAGVNEARSLELELSDAAGQPLAGARPHIVAFHQARAGAREEWTLEPSAGRPGLYTSQVRPGRPGLWEIRVRVQRGPDVFLETFVLAVGPDRAIGAVEGRR